MVLLDAIPQVSFRPYSLAKQSLIEFKMSKNNSCLNASDKKMKSQCKRSNSCVSTQCTNSRGSSRGNNSGIVSSPTSTRSCKCKSVQPPIFLNHVPKCNSGTTFENNKSQNSCKSYQKQHWFYRFSLLVRKIQLCRKICIRSTLRDAATQTTNASYMLENSSMSVSRVTSYCTVLSDSFFGFNSIYSQATEATPNLVIKHFQFSDQTYSKSPFHESETLIESNNAAKDTFCNDLKKKQVDESLEKCSLTNLCSCGYRAHCVEYDKAFPLHTDPFIKKDSYFEALAIAKACCGRWVTIVERSDSLDQQYQYLGVNVFKRAIMNRLAVPLTMFLEDEDTVLHCWIHTPLGVRHMRSNLLGKKTVDEDSDVGVWTGITKVVDYSIPWFCNGNTVRALQQVRMNEERGTCIETRVVVPDKKDNQLMLFNFSMIPRENNSITLSANRILRKQCC